MAAGKRGDRREFVHAYEGPELLGALLEAAGSPFGVDEVIGIMREAIASGAEPRAVIPTLFEGEPRFEDVTRAQVTFQNLLGLWDLLASGRPLPKQKTERPARPKKPEPVPPGPWPGSGSDGAPDTAWVERAWRYLEDMRERERTRLVHSFENRQDALLGYLDDAGLSDEGYLAARHLVFELHAMIELGWAPGVASVAGLASGGASGAGGAGAEVPSAFSSYVDEALFEAEQDEQAPLPADEAAKVRDVVTRCAAALWSARRSGP